MLWRRCGLVDAPQLLQESDFQRPCNWCRLKCNETRPSFSDVEETAQWAAGEPLADSLLRSLFSNVRLEKNAAILVHHTTGYEAALERAILAPPDISAPIGSFTWAPSLELSQYVKMQIADLLVSQWMHHQGPLTKVGSDKYAAWDDSALPSTSPPTNLRVLRIVDDTLVLPQDLRARFLVDPLRGMEWRKLLETFDRTYGVGVCQAPRVEETLEATVQPSSFDWATVFPTDPVTEQTFKEMYPVTLATMDLQGSKGHLTVVTEGSENRLFLIAKDDLNLDQESWLLGHGAGSWLQDSKAVEHASNNPGKSHIASWHDDAVAVVMEQTSADGPLQTLRAALQALEKNGVVSYEVAGHTISRPSDVLEGGTDRPPYLHLFCS